MLSVTYPLVGRILRPFEADNELVLLLLVHRLHVVLADEQLHHIFILALVHSRKMNWNLNPLIS